MVPQVPTQANCWPALPSSSDKEVVGGAGDVREGDARGQHEGDRGCGEVCDGGVDGGAEGEGRVGARNDHRVPDCTCPYLKLGVTLEPSALV